MTDESNCKSEDKSPFELGLDKLNKVKYISLKCTCNCVILFSRIHIQFVLSQKSTSEQPTALKYVTLQFVVDFYEQVIKPLDLQMTTKKVISELLKPYSKTKGGSFMDSVNSFAEQHNNTVFISHCHENTFVHLMQSLIAYYGTTKLSEIFLLIDLFAIDQNKTTGELQDQLRRSSMSILVVMKDKAYPAEELMTLMDDVRTYQTYYQYHMYA